MEHWPFTAEGTLRNVAIDQYTLNVDNVLHAIAAWDAAHPVVTNPPAVTPPPLDLGLPATAPEWMPLFADAFGDLPDIEPGEGNGAGGNGGNGSTTAPTTPAWLAQLQNLVARGVQHLNAPPTEPGEGTPTNLPPDDGPIETIETEAWLTIAHLQSGVHIAAIDDDSGSAVRVVDGRLHAVEQAAVEAMAASESARNWTVADWDCWFALNGNEAPITQSSLAALQTTLNAAVNGFGPIIDLNGDTAFDSTLDNRQSLQSQKERIDALVNGSAVTPQIYDVVTYAALVAQARASLKSPTAFDSDAIADAFIEDYGYSGLLRLYRMEREGRWNVAVRNLTREEVRVQYGEYVTHYGDGPLHEIEAAKTLLINDRVLNGQLIAQPERPEQADAHTIAARIHTAIYAEGITVHNAGVQTESTAAAAWQAFLADPKVRISFGTVQLVGALWTMPATLGASSVPGITLYWRGLDEIVSGIRAMQGEDNNVRSMTAAALDHATGDSRVSDHIVLGIDVGTSIVSVRTVAVGATGRASLGVATVSAWNGSISESVFAASRSLVEDVAPNSMRSLTPFPSPRPTGSMNAIVEASYPGTGIRVSRAQLKEFGLIQPIRA